MTTRFRTFLALAAAVLLASTLACGGAGAPAVAESAATAPAPSVQPTAATVPAAQPAPAATAPSGAPPEDGGAAGAAAFTGSREETERFIGYYQSIRLTPEQERVKVAALSEIPAPCCANNPLATCCCPCNMAKAAWGMSAWLITEKGYGADQVRQAAEAWLAAANPDGFTGDACYTGGCSRAIRHNGCGGMDDRQVL